MALKNNLMFCNILKFNKTLLLIYCFHFLKIIKDAVNKSCMNRIICTESFYNLYLLLQSTSYIIYIVEIKYNKL